MTPTRSPLNVTGRHWAIMLAIAGLGFVLHVATAGNYGIFRDELYYLDCARHLDWGYVDHPPLSIALLKFAVFLCGDSVGAIRILPAVAGVLLVIFTGLLALRFGGDRFSVLLASLSALVVPVYLVNSGFYSMNVFELMFWAGLYLILAQIAIGEDTRLWLWFGAFFGLGLLNKMGIAALAVGLIPALLLTGNGRHLKSRHFWQGALLGLLIFLPHLIWQAVHDWPTAEFVRNATAGKIVHFSLWQYFTEQILMLNPGLLPIWLLGLGSLLFWRRLRTFRLLGIIWLAAFLFFGLQRSKPYYLSPAYPPLLAAGACVFAHAFRQRLKWMRPILVVLVASAGIFIAPFAVPLLPPDSLVTYMERAGVHPGVGETSAQASLPQYFADRFGWENMAVTIAEAYRRVPDSLRADCAIVARNYGEAGAINYFGPKLGLPRAISQHNSYFLWGPGKATGRSILAVNYAARDLRRNYEDVSLVATVRSAWAMPYETDVPVYFCRGLRVPWTDAWRAGKFFY